MPISKQDAAHLLRRAGFGGTDAEVAQLATMERAAAVDSLIDVTPAAVSGPAVQQFVDTKWEAYEPLVKWWLNEMATTATPLVEKMALFWHGHFVSSLDKSELMPMWQQNQVFRQMGMGSFHELLHNVSFGPAMLDYLDNRDNKKDARNENFARELMELFTLGAGNYTQDDVVACARAFTGHNMDEARFNYQYSAKDHDTGNKTYLGVTKNWDGPDVLAALCNGQPGSVTARHIATKLWDFFAYKGVDGSVIESLTEAFAASNLDLKALLRAIFMHDEFYSDNCKRGHVRSPAEFVVAIARYSGISIETMNPQWLMESMGQQLWFPPNVAGWPGDTSWITSSATWAKGNYARQVVWAEGYDALLGDTEKMTPGDAARYALGTFGVDVASTGTIQAIEQAVTAERAANGWAERQLLIVMTLMSPEFQIA